MDGVLIDGFSLLPVLVHQIDPLQIETSVHAKNHDVIKFIPLVSRHLPLPALK